ncbi:hypothetical protein [Sphingobium bisphenolivorans]|uniref:hypothetical protein n=1 Tax=Sphingobium bisphenolivorans TaxID=1335760 RepID=UPI00039AFA70|nr:hypothetical protein [Sphingobium bisphenolivorans]
MPHEWLGSRVRIILEDISDIVGHRVMRGDASVTHRIEFQGGGHALILFSSDGCILRFEGRKISASFVEHSILLGRA